MCQLLPAKSVATGITLTASHESISCGYISILNRHTILLARPTTRCKAIMAQGKWPFEVGPNDNEDSPSVPSLLRTTHTSPLSVLGGAKASGFCKSIGIFCGPITLPPTGPRKGSGIMFESGPHSG
jgi:hypothetical protein